MHFNIFNAATVTTLALDITSPRLGDRVFLWNKNRLTDNTGKILQLRRQKLLSNAESKQNQGGAEYRERGKHLPLLSFSYS